jgi:periplasmic divalent cation tolerance protein
VSGPIKSGYWWNGKIERAKEWYCLIKGRAEDYSLIEANIKKMHCYKVPEILATPILQGDPKYLRWIRDETTRNSKSKKVE